MKFSSEIIDKVKKMIDDLGLDYEYDYIGVRVQETPFELGPIDHLSHVWVDNEDIGEELPGICATRINSLGENYYYGDHAAIICGYSAEYGQDVGEIIIADAIVSAVIC